MVNKYNYKNAVADYFHQLIIKEKGKVLILKSKFCDGAYKLASGEYIEDLNSVYFALSSIGAVCKLASYGYENQPDIEEFARLDEETKDLEHFI